jgi:serine protease Do
VSGPLPSGDESLVPADAPVYDTTLRGVDLADIDLERFWHEREGAREPVRLDHLTFARVAEGAREGVVNIYTRRIEKRELRLGIHPNDLLPIRIPIASALLDAIPFQVPLPFRSEGLSLGSGFVVNEGGYVLTNAHVLENATDVRVVFSGGQREYPARIVGSDRVTDTALLHIEGSPDVVPLPLGRSSDLAVGEMVIAMGNPLGLSHTVTQGMVSAKERMVPGEAAPLVDFIQTDSAINPGSSGGPLLNLYGEVVGINTAIVTTAQLIGFAVPIDTVKSVLPLLVVGEARRGWLGISVATDDVEARARALEAGGVAGVAIETVEAGSPAEAAGLRAGDRIVALDGAPIPDVLALQRRTVGLLAEETVRFTVRRGSDLVELEATLAPRPPDA